MANHAQARQKVAIRGKARQAGVGNRVTQTSQTVRGDDNQVAGGDIIHIEHLHINLAHRSPDMTATDFDPEFPYRLSEEQQTKLYHAQHLLTVLDSLAMVGIDSDKFVDIPRESLAIVFGMASNLVKEGMPSEGIGG